MNIWGTIYRRNETVNERTYYLVKAVMVQIKLVNMKKYKIILTTHHTNKQIQIDYTIKIFNVT